MVESERTVTTGALQGDEQPRRVCSQLLADPARYSLWRVRHGKRMLSVAERKHRDRQILALRAVHLEQIHRTALVNYLRKHGITGAARDLTLSEFYGVMDPRHAALTEHKSYSLALPSQLSACELLKLVGDRHGLALIQDYQGTYGQFFGMFCDRARATRNQTTYLLNAFIADAKSEADVLRSRILSGERLPSAPVAIKASSLARRRISNWR
jgi:hypothetical protein